MCCFMFSVLMLHSVFATRLRLVPGAVSWQAGHYFHVNCVTYLYAQIVLKKGPTLSVSLLPHNAAFFPIVTVKTEQWFFGPIPPVRIAPFFPLRTQLPKRRTIKHFLIILQNQNCLMSI